jgi:sterol desaturase/sphingolipid hydroxylase (fatty acid hydroxylase superfamily)
MHLAPDFSRLTPLVLAAVFLLLLALEAAFPLRVRRRPLIPRLVVNLSFLAGVFALGIYVVRPVALALALGAADYKLGLLNLVTLPYPARFILGFLLMDLTFYWWHRANHVFSLLWRFHSVHHLDPDLDVSTSFRFHWGEILYSTGFRVLQVGLLGVDPFIYLTYELVYELATFFQHSNIRLPLTFERGLNQALVTPRMHGVHHSVVSEEVGSNFSVIFRWWDSLHRTLTLNVPQRDITIGVAGYLAAGDNRLLRLLALPFRLSPDYWRFPDGKVPTRDKTGPTFKRGFMLK